MPELLLELLTEEIPARMQARAADDLCRLVAAALAPVAQGPARAFSGPRRIGLVVEVAARAETPAKEERGPRVSAPEAALAGFLKKHGAAREDVIQVGDFWVLVKPGSSIEAAALVAAMLPDVLWSFPWPKSMRWGISAFNWVRPLQRILCLLDGSVVPFALARGEDAVHGLTSGDVTEGHRVHASGAFAVSSHADYVAKLREHFVVVETAERVALIRDGVSALAAAEGLEVVPDEGLLAEVAGLVEWPVPLLGSIDAAFMDLPAEVMRTSMRVNQRYFALRTPAGRAAPRFALVANIEASDGGTALVAGNERVLRARLSDARFFWDQDLKTPLEALLPKLDGVVFHAKLGTQGQRVRRLERLAAHIAPMVGADPALAVRAARLAKADLASGMVGEFPELQGMMGGYYAQAAGEPAAVADAIAQHYRPLGPADAVPDAPVAVAVALADKLDQLAGFFAADERPTGSSDPFALRRAMLGIIRIIISGSHELELKRAFALALEPFETLIRGPEGAGDFDAFMAKRDELVAFLVDRLRVQLRETGLAAGVINAVAHPGAVVEPDTDINRVIARANLLSVFLCTPQGEAMLGAYRRATNILRNEEKKQVLEPGEVDQTLLNDPAEKQLDYALKTVGAFDFVARNDYLTALNHLGAIRSTVDAFFENVLVNDPDEKLRKNRLRLLSRLKSAMDTVADLSKIEA